MDNSLQNIQQSIAEKQSFILEAGAGSGKTWSLVESIKYIINHESQNLAKHNYCIASALNFNKLQKYTSNVHQIQETAQNSLTSQAI